MLRTDSLEVYDKVCDYIATHYCPDNYDLPKTDNVQEMCYNILTICRDERCKEGFRTNYELLIDTMRGLPAILRTFPLLNCTTIDLVGDWLEQTETERNNYSVADAQELALHLVVTAIIKEARKWIAMKKH